jgi:hypothetical protein
VSEYRHVEPLATNLAATEPRSSRSKARSVDEALDWCSSTAIVLLPATRRVVGRLCSKNAASSAPPTTADAGVVYVTAPVGMFWRVSSWPFR